VAGPEASHSLLETPLAALHRALGGRMVPFAGYAMPVQYPAGIMAEHLHCRAAAALFDVAHMGQAFLEGPGAAAALERATPADVQGLKPGRQRYGLLTTEAGGIFDDFMVATLAPDRLFLVVNASRKAEDFARIAAAIDGTGARLTVLDDRALLALQGPEAAAALAPLAPDLALDSLSFLGVAEVAVAGIPAIVARSGYTGEDGFEISVPADRAEALAKALLARPGVQPAGLGARDSLRLEAGLCLYGNDIDETTSPVEAALTWTIGKRRRMAWDFPGAERVREELANGALRLRVGLRPEGRQPARAETPVHAEGGALVGTVTSGGFGPSANGPVAMGYVARPQAADGTPLTLMVRGKPLPAHVAPLPFVPHRYRR
jgi:aminomethyltransferase